MAKKWLDSIEKRRRKSNVCDKRTCKQTESTSKNSRLLGEARSQQTDRVNDKKIIDF